VLDFCCVKTHPTKVGWVFLFKHYIILILILEENMTYFQNPFASEFRGNWVIGDRQYSMSFVCPCNAGRSDEIVSNWKNPLVPYYDLSGNDSDGNPKSVLSIRLTVNGGFQDWTTIEIDLADNAYANLDPAPSANSIKSNQIVAILNAHPTFSSYFLASFGSFDQYDNYKNNIRISQKFPTSRMKYFIVNTGAEEVLGFNAKAGVAELPSYFARSKVFGGDMTLPMDGINILVELSPSNSGGTSVIDDNIIDNALDAKGVLLGFNSNSMKADWELLKGRASGAFTFQKLTVDGSDRITQIIEYPAGAVVGDFARKINYTYTSSNTNPNKVTEIPHVLTEGDLVTP
jgi:hypothetical protein